MSPYIVISTKPLVEMNVSYKHIITAYVTEQSVILRIKAHGVHSLLQIKLKFSSLMFVHV